MQRVLQATCRTGTGALRRAVCQAGRRSGAGPPLPATAPLHKAGLSSSSGAGSGQSGKGLTGVLRQLREQRRLFRTFSSSTSGGTGGSGGAAGGSGGSGGGGGGGSGSGGSSGGLWAAYLALLERRPLATKAVSAAVLNGLGDVLAQKWFEQGAFDWRRLSVFTFLGLVLIGPALHVWYGQLGRIVTAPGNAGAAARMALDQLCFAPFFISTIVTAIMALEGKASEAPARLRRDLPDIVKSNWLLWVPFQFVNFRFVPPQLQVLSANMVALIWNTYMSWKSHA